MISKRIDREPENDNYRGLATSIMDALRSVSMDAQRPTSRIWSTKAKRYFICGMRGA